MQSYDELVPPQYPDWDEAVRYDCSTAWPNEELNDAFPSTTQLRPVDINLYNIGGISATEGSLAPTIHFEPDVVPSAVMDPFDPIWADIELDWIGTSAPVENVLASSETLHQDLSPQITLRSSSSTTFDITNTALSTLGAAGDDGEHTSSYKSDASPSATSNASQSTSENDMHGPIRDQLVCLCKYCGLFCSSLDSLRCVY